MRTVLLCSAAFLLGSVISISDVSVIGARGGPSPKAPFKDGAAAAALAVLSPTALRFAAQNVGTTSAPQALTLSNPGSAALAISSIAIGGANPHSFARSSNCGSSLAAGAACTISVFFTPTVPGTLAAALVVVDNAPGSPQAVALLGVAVAATATATLSPTALDFGSQNVGATGPPQTVTLLNSGNAALVVASMEVTGADSADFSVANGCGSTVAAGGSCTFAVTFTPTRAGARTAAVTLNDSASDSPQTVSLSGTGAVSSPISDGDWFTGTAGERSPD